MFDFDFAIIDHENEQPIYFMADHNMSIASNVQRAIIAVYNASRGACNTVTYFSVGHNTINIVVNPSDWDDGNHDDKGFYTIIVSAVNCKFSVPEIANVMGIITELNL